MNPIIEAAARSVSLGWLMGVMTVVFVLWFAAWTWWAFAPRNKEKFEEAARMPLSEGGEQ